MINQRDEMYFEPRVIDDRGDIRWYGERYTSGELLARAGNTVYVRDNGNELFAYLLDSDQINETDKIEAVFTLLCRIGKNRRGYRYGRKIT